MVFLIKKCKKKVFFFKKKFLYIHYIIKNLIKVSTIKKSIYHEMFVKKTKKKVDCMRVLLFKQKKNREHSSRSFIEKESL